MTTTETPDTPEPGSAAKLLAKNAVAALLSITVRTLDSWVRRGYFPPPMRVGDGKHTACRWREADVIAWVEQHLPGRS